MEDMRWEERKKLEHELTKKKRRRELETMDDESSSAQDWERTGEPPRAMRRRQMSR